MSSDYIFKFTDTAVPILNVPAYHVDGPVSPILNSPIDHTSNQTHYPVTSTSPTTTLVLVGKGVADYGETVQQNLIYLLENFANNTPPVTPIIGQTWFNKQLDTLSVRKSDHTWGNLINSTGGTFTGNVTLTATPVNDDHIVTKLYVDNITVAVGAQVITSSYDSITRELSIMLSNGSSAVVVIPRDDVIRSKQVSAGGAIFTIPEYTVGTNRLSIFANGLKQSLDDDYVETSSITVTFNNIVPVSTKLEFIYI